MPATVAVFGLGTMGTGMARTLATAGYDVVGVDPLLTTQGGAATPVPLVEPGAAIQRCGTLLLSLPGSEQVNEVLFGPDGLVAHAREQRLIIDTSTCDPLYSMNSAEKLDTWGHHFVDAPVSGGALGAANGTLTVFLGGHETAVASATDVVNTIAAKVTHVGGPGTGHLSKLVNNLLCATHLQIAGEALRLAHAAGIEADRIIEAVNSASGRSAVTEVNLPRWVLSGEFDSGFTIGLMARDVALAENTAQEMDVDSPMTAMVAQTWQEIREKLGAGEDFNRMAQP